MDRISRFMKIKDIRAVLDRNGIDLPLHWETALWLLFNTYNADEAEIVGFGASAEFKFIPRDEKEATP